MEGPYGAGEAHLRDVQWLHIHGGDDGGGCYLCDFVAGQELVAELLPELHLDIILLDQWEMILWKLWCDNNHEIILLCFNQLF